MGLDTDYRTGRHGVFQLHVHLVFVTKYRRNVLSDHALLLLERIFARVCTDFEAELVACDGEDDHVHLRVTYPPKVAISKLVNSLKGVPSRRLRQAPGGIARGCSGHRHMLLRPAAAHRSTSLRSMLKHSVKSGHLISPT